MKDLIPDKGCLRLDVPGQGVGMILDVDGQGERRVLKSAYHPIYKKEYRVEIRNES